MLKIYNTKSAQKQPLEPIVPGQIGLYVCGVTVYDYCHIGHARTWLAFDVVVRYLQYQGFKVNYIRNITDIDDKIIKKANEANKSTTEITDYYIKEMRQNAKDLNLLPPSKEPKATEYIQQMIDLTQKLVDTGFAYVGENGDVFFEVDKFKDYGKLSKRNLEKLQAGSRVNINQAKRNPLDFVLWKMAKPNEVNYPSPWGAGRPGWHIECSAMSMQLLGETFDIHGGGFDLQFPHHENECAQSSAITDKELANIWMHVGFLEIEQEKMSKSLGNFTSIKDILLEYQAEVIRYFSITAHYRSSLDFSTKNLENANNSLTRLYTALKDIEINSTAPENHQFEEKFCNAMNDDFNTPQALVVLFELAKEINKQKLSNLNLAQELAALLVKLGNIIGILFESPNVFIQQDAEFSEDEKNQIESLIIRRNDARTAKNFQVADEVRDILLNKYDVVLEDNPQGTSWRKSNS